MGDDTCPQCGYCKNCGRSNSSIPVPYEVPPLTTTYRWTPLYPYFGNTRGASTVNGTTTTTTWNPPK